MKKKKALLSVLLSAVMAVSMVATPVTAVAAEYGTVGFAVEEKADAPEESRSESALDEDGTGDDSANEESKAEKENDGESREHGETSVPGEDGVTAEKEPAGGNLGIGEATASDEDTTKEDDAVPVGGEAETPEDKDGEVVTGDASVEEIPGGGEASEEIPTDEVAEESEGNPDEAGTADKSAEEGLTDGEQTEEDLPDGGAVEENLPDEEKSEGAEDEITFEGNSFDAVINNSPYALVVGGVPVTPSNKDDIKGLHIKDGTVKYDPDTHVLTLDNATITMNMLITSDLSEVLGIYYAKKDELIIETIGINDVTGAHYEGDYERYQGIGIYTAGPLTLRGDGTLNVRLDETRKENTFYNYGIYCRYGLTIESGTVDVKTPKTKFGNRGIYVHSGNFTMTDGDVTIQTGDAEATGTYSAATAGINCYACTISGGKLDITSGSAKANGSAYQSAYGISGTDILIAGGTVNLRAGNVPEKNINTFANGICAVNKLVISGGTVTADGGSCDEGIGIRAKGDLEITGGRVIAKGLKCAISAEKGFTPIDGLTLKASNNYTGEPIETYNADNLGGYKYIETTPMEYKLWVSGERVTFENASNITNSGIKGKVSYDPGTNTLTLDNATITGNTGNGSGAGIYYTDAKPLIIEMTGVNTVKGVKVGNDSGWAISCSSAPLTFEGEGSITASFEDSSVTTNIAILAKAVTVESGQVAAISERGKSSSYAVKAIEGVTINGGTLTAKSGNISNSAAIYAGKDVIISGGIVSAKAFANGTSQYGIQTSGGAIKIKGGTVKAWGGKAMDQVPDMTGFSGWQAKAYATKDATTYTKYDESHSMPSSIDCQYMVVGEANYDLWVGGVSVTASNCSNIKGANITGFVSYDDSTRTLTLDNAHITGMKNDADSQGAGIYSDVAGGLTIVFTGDNAVSGADYEYETDNIDCKGINARTDLTLRENTSQHGILRVTADSESDTCWNVYGIYSDGTLTMESGTVISAGGNAEYTSHSQSKYGIYTYSLQVMDGNLTAVSGDASDGNSTGIYLCSDSENNMGKITVSGGTLSAASGKCENNYGVRAYLTANIEITGGTFVSKGYNNAVYYININYDSYNGTAVKKASTSYDGSSAVNYVDSSKDTYKYIRISGSTVKTYNLYVGGTQVTEDNCHAITGDGIKKGTVSYDPGSKTLHLQDAEIEGSSTSTVKAGAGIWFGDSADTLTVTFDGTNKITSAVASTTIDGSSGIRSEGGLTVKGADAKSTLHVNANASKKNTGISVVKKLIIDGGRIYITAGDITAEDNFSGSYGIFAGGEVILNPDHLQIQSGKGGYSASIYSGKDITVQGGTLFLVAGTAGSGKKSRALDCASTGTIRIEDGTVLAVGGSGSTDGDSFGINGGAVEITGGSVYAAGGDHNKNSYGIYATQNDVTISGGVVSAAGNALADGGVSSTGIAAETGNIFIKGGTVTAYGYTVAMKSVPDLTGYKDPKVTASTDYIGKDAVAYTESDHNSYNYINIQMDIKSYGLYVGGIEVTSVNADNITGGDDTYGILGGSVSYDADTGTLKLVDAHIRGKEDDDTTGGTGITNGVEGGLTIEFTGANVVEGAGYHASYCTGIDMYSDLTLQGSGTLTVNAVLQDVDNWGIYGYNGKIYMNSGAVTVNAVGNGYGRGISSERSDDEADIYVKGGTFTVCGDMWAVYRAPDVKDYGNVQIKASENTSGTPIVEYKEGDIGIYKYLQIAEDLELHEHEISKTEGISATCTESGMKGYYTCSKCGKFYEDKACEMEIADLTAWKAEGGAGVIDALGHSVAKVEEKLATCTEPGHKEYYMCSVCEEACEEETFVTPITDLAAWKAEGGAGYLAPGHTWSTLYTKENADVDKHYHICAVCGEKDAGEAHAWNAGAATETEDKYCTVCGYVAEVALNHEHAGVKTEGIQTTCTESGMKEYYICSKCGKSFEDETCGKEITDLAAWKAEGGAGYLAPGHQWSTSYTKENADADKHYHVCAVCGEKDAGEAHAWNAEAATETEDKHCTVCGYVTEVALGHEHVGVKTEGTPATCTESGMKEYYTCSKCGKCFEDEACEKEITDLAAWKAEGGAGYLAPGHQWGTSYTKENADADKHYHVCAVCGEKDAGESHAWNAEAATETEDKHCTACGYVAEVALSHVHAGTRTEGKPATCTEAGVKDYYTCECGQIFEDAACTKQVTNIITWKVISALGHDFIDDFDEEVHWKECQRCGELAAKQPHVFDDADDRDCNVCSYARGLSITIIHAQSVDASGKVSYTYTGSAVKPEIIVRNYAKVLTEGVDYTVSYKNNVKSSAGVKAVKKLPTITVKGKGNFAGTASKTFGIDPRPLADVQVGSIVVTKNSKASPLLLYNGVKLTAKDFTNPDSAKKFKESGSITVTGKGNYTGTAVIPVKVVASKADLKKFKVTLGTEKLVYDGTEKKISYTVRDAADKTPLSQGTDYEVFYAGDTVNAGTVKISFVGIGEYTGSIIKKYTIKPNTAGVMQVTGINTAGYAYTPTGATPGADLEVNCGGKVLICGKDYTVAYKGKRRRSQCGTVVPDGTAAGGSPCSGNPGCSSAGNSPGSWRMEMQLRRYGNGQLLS